MTIRAYLQLIAKDLIQVHAELFRWFEIDEAMKQYRPEEGGWTIAEILEHVSMTSHFLLLTIGKITPKALRKAEGVDLTTIIDAYHFDVDKLEAIGKHKSFAWIRPEHMEPTGAKTDLEIKRLFTNQLSTCLNHLETLRNGEGLLQLTTMSANNLGKISVYEFIYFLGRHAERHVEQMQRNKEDFERKNL